MRWKGRQRCRDGHFGGRVVRSGDWRCSYSVEAILLFVTVCLLLLDGGTALDGVNCCRGPEAVLDCSSGVESEGQYYYCMPVKTPERKVCVSCIPPASDVVCTSCCGTKNSECNLEWSWGAVLATLSVSAIFATCSGVLALAEKRRKRKGISLARAWSLPHGMPVLRATVIDLSDAVRGRSSTWGYGGDGPRSEELEHVGLLEEVPSDSIYGALVGQGDGDIPVAKLAEDNWATAMAWRQACNIRPYELVEEKDDGDEEENDGAPPPLSPPTSSLSRWRSARAVARQVRRSAAAALRRRDPPGDQLAGNGDYVDGGGRTSDQEEQQATASLHGEVEESAVVASDSPPSSPVPVDPS